MGIVGDWLKKISGHGGDADVLANYENVEIVTDELKSIATMGVGNAQDAIYAAVNQLNSLPGMAEYVGTVQVSNYDGVFQSISKSINNIADQIQGKAEDIKAYDESKWYEKAFSTATMVLAKGTEGILSVVEDLGDGIVTVAGWVSSNEQFKQNCADFIAKEWSHDALNFYYDSEFAKYSAFTEDSSIAGVVKGAGVVAGYIGAGYLCAGALGLGATTTYGAGILSASGLTWGGTLAAGIAGMGTKMESQVIAAKINGEEFDYDAAAGKAAVAGAKDAITSFAIGKTAESAAGALKAKAAAKAAVVADKLDEAAKVADHLDEAAKVADHLDEAAKVADHLDEAAKGKNIIQKAINGIKNYPGRVATAIVQNGVHITPQGLAQSALQTGSSLSDQNPIHAAETRYNLVNQEGLVDTQREAINITPNSINTTYTSPIPAVEKIPLPGNGAEQPLNPNGNSETPQNPGGNNGNGNGGGGGGRPTPTAPTVPAIVPEVDTVPITTPTITTPVTQPPITQPPITQPPVTQPPITHPPYTQPPYTSPYKDPTTTPGQHSGGGYGSDGYTGDGTGSNLAASIADVLDDSEKSIDEIIKGSKYSRIPTSSKPILSSKSSGTSSVIPIAAGLSVASAAGLGAKAYLDHKRAQSEDDEEDEEYDEDYEADDDFVVDGWTEGDDTLAIDPDEESNEFINQDKQDDDEYYHAAESPFPIMSQEELEEF